MLRIQAIHLGLILILGLPFFACGDDNQGQGQGLDSLMTDSIPVDTATGLAAQVVVPELVGRWQLVEMRNGDMPMSTDDIGESVMELTPTGRMITSAPDLPPEEVEFSYRNDSLYNEDFGTVQRIEALTSDQLILLMEIDNTPIRWIYRRMPPQ
ncbi:MAG: hypothetical protein D6722_28220 [Bacteroidetes bacterium]|nr:MAG: hypothetical protein D6722_28220 [Bacteroidota bacterium]